MFAIQKKMGAFFNYFVAMRLTKVSGGGCNCDFMCVQSVWTEYIHHTKISETAFTPLNKQIKLCTSVEF